MWLKVRPQESVRRNEIEEKAMAKIHFMDFFSTLVILFGHIVVTNSPCFFSIH